jgi:acyl carrier protein
LIKHILILINELVNKQVLFSEKIVIEEDTNLFESVYLDSLNIVELVISLEEAFDINISMDLVVYENLYNVRRWAELIESLMSERK